MLAPNYADHWTHPPVTEPFCNMHLEGPLHHYLFIYLFVLKTDTDWTALWITFWNHPQGFTHPSRCAWGGWDGKKEKSGSKERPAHNCCCREGAGRRARNAEQRGARKQEHKEGFFPPVLHPRSKGSGFHIFAVDISALHLAFMVYIFMLLCLFPFRKSNQN